MTTIQYVFWDCDNTLVNTAEQHWRKHYYVLKEQNITLPEKYRQRIYENNGSQNWQWLHDELGLSLPQEEYLQQIDAWYYNHLEEIDVREGVLEAIRYFADNKILQAVVSNGRKNSVMAVLNAKDMTRHFTFILCKEDYEGRKPDPLPYLTALKQMEVHSGRKISPQNCLVIEDDPLGVRAGKAAGMSVLFRSPEDKTPINLLIS